MQGQLRCKKCGRILKSPASIARGMGPKCAGVSATSGNSIQVRVKRSFGTAYQSSSSNHAHAALFPGDLSRKRLSNRELYRRLREERRRSFETREPFQCGVLLPKRRPLVYTPLDDGNWRENPSGRVMSHERLQEYLRRFHFI